MSRRVQRVKYHLDAKGIKQLSEVELRAILRGADDLIMSGGRSLLAKVLKGSRAKEVLDLTLNESPVYGFYEHLSEDDILARIDWVILHEYLAIAYDYRLPLLRYTPQGWDIEKETYAKELLHGFDEMLTKSHLPYDMSYLKDRSRDMIWLLLDKVEASQERKYIPLLEAWEQVDYKKVKERIQQVIAHLNQNAA